MTFFQCCARRKLVVASLKTFVDAPFSQRLMLTTAALGLNMSIPPPDGDQLRVLLTGVRRHRSATKSFMDTLRDQEFLTEINKANLAVTPVSGDVIDGIVSGFFKLDARMVAKLKRVLVS